MRALSPETLPPPPNPPAIIELLGYSSDRAELLRAAAPRYAHIVHLDASAPIAGAALVVESSALSELETDRKLVVIVGPLDERMSRRAYHLGAQVLLSDPAAPELLRLCKLASRAAFDDVGARRAWARTALATWVLDVLGACGITPRRAQILGLFASGERRSDAAEALGISLKKVDHHVGEILAATGQLRVEDVVAPFRDRLARELDRTR